MAEITLGDLLQWQLGLTFRPAIGEREELGLERPITWAVTVRTTLPILPALRGGEIVVVPPANWSGCTKRTSAARPTWSGSSASNRSPR